MLIIDLSAVACADNGTNANSAANNSAVVFFNFIPLLSLVVL
jgi:hypothetical protein